MAAKTASLSVNIIADAAKARAGLKEAETAFGKFSREVGNAQGAMGKFKTIGGAALDSVKANAVGFATAAATAIGAFVVKSVMGFQDLAIAAGKFSDATGLSTEEASRFIEVAGDFGVEAGAVEKAIGFMNKTLGNSPELFRQLGVDVAYASNGATDVNATFLNVVRRLKEIEDPAKRGALAAQLLGRGWSEMAELIAMGADELAASLASVSDGKIISPEEQANAEALRAEVDRLKGSWEDFANTVGSTVIPLLADGIGFVNDLIEKIPLKDQLVGFLKDSAEFAVLGPFKTAKDGIELVGNAIGWLRGDTEKTYVVTDKLKESWIGGYRAMIDARTESEQLAASLRHQAEDVETARLKWDEFRNGLNIQQQSLRLTQNIEDFRTKWAGTTDEAKRKSREYQQELLRIQIELSNAALSILGLASTAQNTRIRLMIETGRLEQALSLIQAIQRGMNSLAGAPTPDRVERLVGQAPTGGAGTGKPVPPKKPPTKPPVKPAASYGGPTVSTIRVPGIATGGTITAGGMALVGEQGPELVNLPRGASVIPSIPSRKMMGGGTTVNIQVQAGLVSSPDQVGQQIIDAIRRAERRSGQVFANV
jgi:hypothetical protein